MDTFSVVRILDAADSLPQEISWTNQRHERSSCAASGPTGRRTYSSHSLSPTPDHN